MVHFSFDISKIKIFIKKSFFFKFFDTFPPVGFVLKIEKI